MPAFASLTLLIWACRKCSFPPSAVLRSYRLQYRTWPLSDSRLMAAFDRSPTELIDQSLFLLDRRPNAAAPGARLSRCLAALQRSALSETFQRQERIIPHPVRRPGGIVISAQFVANDHTNPPIRRSNVMNGPLPKLPGATVVTHGNETTVPNFLSFELTDRM